MVTMELPEALPNSPTIEYLVWLAENIYKKPNSWMSKVLRLKNMPDLNSLVEAMNNRHTFIVKRIIYFIAFINFLQRGYYNEQILFPNSLNVFINSAKRKGIDIENEISILLDWKNTKYFLEDPFYEREIVKAYTSILSKVSRLEISLGRDFEVNWIKQSYEG